MPTFNIASDLNEVIFSPEELNTAMQMKDKQLSLMLLQNTRIGLIRRLAAFEFSRDNIELDLREHSVLKGRLEQLDEVISGILEPTPIPVDTSQPSFS